MAEVLGGVLVVVLILGFSAWLTALMAGRMYLKCPSCRTLNAHRRIHCRACGTVLRDPEPTPGADEPSPTDLGDEAATPPPPPTTD